jgi:hypothetical protein
MIERQWDNFLDELLAIQDFELIQKRLREELDKKLTPSLLHRVLWPLAVTTPDDFVTNAVQLPDDQTRREKLLEAMHLHLKFIQFYLAMPNRLESFAAWLFFELVPDTEKKNSALAKLDHVPRHLTRE